MKNVISTFAFLAVLAAIGFGVYYYTTMAGEKEFSEPLNANKDIPGMLAADKQLEVWEHERYAFKIKNQIGDKLAEALANRDAGGITGLLDSEFSADIPLDSKWVHQEKGNVKQKTRMTNEEQIDTVTGSGFTEYLFEQIFGQKIDHAEFQIIEIKKIKDSKSLDEKFACKCLLEASGLDESGHHRFYSSLGEVGFRFAEAKKVETATGEITYWNFREETSTTVSHEVLKETTEQLALSRIDFPDNWKLEHGDPALHNFQMAVEDFDLDGDYDIAIMTSSANRKILAYEDGKYRDVTKKLGIKELDGDPFGSSVFSTAWIDYNNDGYPDLLSGIRLFRNEGGKKFTRLKNDGIKLEAEIMGVSVVDFDCDGLPDVYTYYKRPYGLAERQTEGQPKGTANWIEENETGKPNHLYRNNGDGTFSDVTELTDASGGFSRTTATSWFFHNDDRYPDLFLVNHIGPDKLLISRKDGSYFDDVSDSMSVCQTGANNGVATGDFDNDGKSDIYVTGLNSNAGRRVLNLLKENDFEDSVFARLQDRESGDKLFLQKDGGKYKASSKTVQANQSGWGWGPTAFDLNSDGWLDLYATAGLMSFDREKGDGLPSLWKAVVTQPQNWSLKIPPIGKIDIEAGEAIMPTPIKFSELKSNLGSYQKNKLYVNLGNGKLADISFSSPANIDSDSRSVVSVDVDRDGTLDLIVGSAGGGGVRVFSNQMEQGNRMEIRLKGVKSNSLGIGSRITAEFGDRKIVRDLFPKNGFMGTGPANVWLGLGDAQKIDKLTIRWPTGQSQILENVEVNRSVRIEEDNPEVETIVAW